MAARALSPTRPLGQIATPMSDAPTIRHIELPDRAATVRLAKAVAALVHVEDVILLEGPLGAGKTEFARAFLRALTGDPALEVPSPSFTLVQSYDTPSGTVHHFDLWRLEGPQRLVDLDWDASCSDIVLVEWPDRLGPLRPPKALAIALDYAGTAPDSRRATLSGWPGRIERLA